jgi:hypothetical protein
LLFLSVHTLYVYRGVVHTIVWPWGMSFISRATSTTLSKVHRILEYLIHTFRFKIPAEHWISLSPSRNILYEGGQHFVFTVGIDILFHISPMSIQSTFCFTFHPCPSSRGSFKSYCKNRMLGS